MKLESVPQSISPAKLRILARFRIVTRKVGGGGRFRWNNAGISGHANDFSKGKQIGENELFYMSSINPNKFILQLLGSAIRQT